MCYNGRNPAIQLKGSRFNYFPKLYFPSMDKIDEKIYNFWATSDFWLDCSQKKRLAKTSWLHHKQVMTNGNHISE
jgi:hypothetical protein